MTGGRDQLRHFNAFTMKYNQTDHYNVNAVLLTRHNYALDFRLAILFFNLYFYIRKDLYRSPSVDIMDVLKRERVILFLIK